jgi:Ca2+-binding RTX toxin-like protein
VSKGKLRLDLVGSTTRTLFNQPLASVKKLSVVGAANVSDSLSIGNIQVRLPSRRTLTYRSFTLPDGLVFDGVSGSATNSDGLSVFGSAGGDKFGVSSEQITANGLSVAVKNVGNVKFLGAGGNDSYAIAALERPVVINDSAGIDTLDFSQCAAGVSIDLAANKGTPQEVLKGKSTLALNGTIENVIGSRFDDVITGNSADNRIWGGDGNDTIRGGGGKDLLYGQGGNDTLFADAGIALLLGGAGNDTLNAGTTDKSRSVLIGGAGEDTLQGSAAQSIMIGGATAYDNNGTALLAILNEWGANGKFQDRVTRLKNGVKTKVNNQSVFVQLKLNGTVPDDLIQDHLAGGAGSEWFLAFATDSVDSGTGDTKEVFGLARSANRRST